MSRPKGSKNKVKIIPKPEEKFNWKKEWIGMPEFVQEDLSPFRSVKINFRNQKDMDTFFELIKQKITKRTSFWYPEAKPRKYSDKRYISES